ncbi:135_t:CDS:2 [Funneliformis mosseae]|uniref:135_t:CDS:1 n=1 Tax=Funneliformis mosseae TaxID=27381 RepID=A0A9N8VE65_FUNMO|nr:135_t:CDS:2 [Funneliformis mosseae]
MSATTVNQPRSQIFTCLACQVAFNTAEAQRTHYGTDWHRYNLKRKVADLPSVTSEVFAQKVLAQQAQSKDADRKASFSAECTACNKIYYSENAYANHLQSNKHKAAEAKVVLEGTNPKKNIIIHSKPSAEGTLQIQNESDINSIIDKKIEVAIALEEGDCLFCTQRFESFDENVQHMTKIHSFFIPEIEYLIDIHGLIKYLGEKISVGNVCLYCNGRGKGMKSLEAVRRHMIDKGHCKIAYETDEDIMELVDFYDFTTKDMELVLPCGKRLGHRSLQKYYRQNLRPIEERDASIINRLITEYSGNSEYTRQSGRLLITRDNVYKNYQPRYVSLREKQYQQVYDTRIGMKANKLQRHFRAQIL